MCSAYKILRPRGIILLLLSMAHLKSGEYTYDDYLLEKEKWELVRQAKITANKIVTINSADLKNILVSKAPLMSVHGNHNESFLHEFKQFLIPFSLAEPQKNDVMKAAAEYNVKHFYGKNKVSIRLWVSFQPTSYDIKDDLDVLTEAINEINKIYSGTVVTVVLNYGLLPLDHESLLLVNHEIKKTYTIIKSFVIQSTRLALQLDIMNCKSRIKFLKKVELSFLDMVLFGVPTKNVVMENENDFPAVMLEQANCWSFLYNLGLFTFQTHISIRIRLDQWSYEYNRNVTKMSQVSGMAEQIAIIFWTELDNYHDTESVTTPTMHSEMSTKWINWLYKPTQFSAQHLGALVTAEDEIPPRIFDTFNKIVIETNGYTQDTRNNLEKILTQLLTGSSSTKPSEHKERHIPRVKDVSSPQVNLLVTITKNDFEINKKQIDTAISAAAYGNQLSPGSVNGIWFDWMTCAISEVCSGYKNVNPNVYCSLFKMDHDMKKIYNYTKFALSKVMKLNTIGLWDIMDAEIFEKIHINSVNRGCEEYEIREVYNITLKFAASERELTAKGAAKLFTTVTSKFGQFSNVFETYDDTKRIPTYYLKITGCDSNYSSTNHLTEFALLYERLNTWAVSDNHALYVDAGIENKEKCQNKQKTVPKMECKCGWWVTTDTTLTAEVPSADNILSKKALALKLYQISVSSKSTNKGSPESSVTKEMFILTLVPAFFTVALVTIVAVVLVLSYQTKYALTKDEVANFLRGRLQENEEPSPESRAYNSAKYELAPSTFSIDKSSCVGSGEFGKVYRGFIARDGENIKSAVKVANIQELGKSHGGRVAIMGLLSEIKILAYLGEHDHIVTLLGAFTGNLRMGEILVFLEFCELGSLYSYLRSIQPNQQQIDCTDDSDALAHVIISSQRDAETQEYCLESGLCDELYGYCSQIACAMAFLASKNVVHADLATRNVLLTREKVVKICDFGLSRRMYDYSEYLKRSQSPLPWRWMPPESLQRLIFNEKSDVWAFGITLWEIFTLGDEPYPGLSYRVNFPAMLEKGVRLPAPRYNVKQIYNVMKRCWSIIPAERPSFAELKERLNETQTLNLTMNAVKC